MHSSKLLKTWKSVLQHKKLAVGVASVLAALVSSGSLYAQTTQVPTDAAATTITTTEGEVETTTPAKPVASSVKVEEQIVTGSLLPTGETSVSPVMIISSDKMVESPSLNMNDFFLLEVTQNAGENTEDATSGMSGGTRGARNASVNIRGLGAENTLILINGVRTVEYAAPNTGTGWRAVDINATIPGIAVNNTQVLLDGGSAIYGTDAVAGVVNYIPDYNYRGFKVDVKSSATEDAYSNIDYSTGLMWGGGNDTTSLIAAYEVSIRNPAAALQAGNNTINLDPSSTDPEWTGATTGTGMTYTNSTNVALAPVRNLEATGPQSPIQTGNTAPTPVPGFCTIRPTGGNNTANRLNSKNERVVVNTCPFTEAPPVSFADPLCGRDDLLERDPIFTGVTNAELNAVDGGSREPGCAQFSRAARIQEETESKDEIAMLALQHQFSDSVKFAAELTWGNSNITDFTEYGGGMGTLVGATLAQLATGVTISPIGAPSFTTGNFIAEWDHPAVQYYTDNYCTIMGLASNCSNPFNPSTQTTVDEFGNTIPAPNTTGIAARNYTAQSYDAITTSNHVSELGRIGSSLTWDISENWSALVGGVYAESRVFNKITDILQDRFSLALDGYGGYDCGITNPATQDPTGALKGDEASGCYYWNPFMSAALPNAADEGLANNTDVFHWFTGPATSDYIAKFWSVSSSVSGRLTALELPGGYVGAAFGLDYRSDTLTTDFDDLQANARYAFQAGNTYTDYSGKTKVLGVVTDFDLPMTDNLNFQFALRGEKFTAGDIDSYSVTPKAGFNWRITEDLTLRGTYTTSFRAPSSYHLAANEGRNPVTVSLLNDNDPNLIALRELKGATYDPSSSDDIVTRYTSVANTLSANPNVQAQTAESFSVGAIWNLTDNLKMTLNYVDIYSKDNIENPGVNYLKTLEQCTELATSTNSLGETYTYYVPIVDGDESRSCFGLANDGNGNIIDSNQDGIPDITNVYSSYYNLSSEKVRALDLSFAYTLETDFGVFTFTPGGTLNLSNQTNNFATNGEWVNITGVSIAGGVGSGGSEWKLNLPIAWSYDKHSISLTGRMVAGIDAASATGQVVATTIDSEDYITMDAAYRYFITDDIRLSFTASNLMNTQPDRAGASFPSGLKSFGLTLNMDFPE